ncbi:hypothetical protein D3C75_1138820 [compost metagenome]
MVPDLSGVVEYAAGGGLDDLDQGFAFELAAFHQIVQVNHVGVMVLAIVVFQSFCGNVRFESVFLIR